MVQEALQSVEDQVEYWVDRVMAGQNPFASFSEKQIEEIYALAYLLYQKKRYEEASYCFQLLTIISPLQAKTWKGLGACLQMQRDYEGALSCYFCSTQVGNQDLDPYLYVQTADCYFALQQVEAGLQALKVAHMQAKKQENVQVLQHVAFMHQLWSHKHVERK